MYTIFAVVKIAKDRQCCIQRLLYPETQQETYLYSEEK